MGHTTRETYEREIFTKSERDTEIEREREKLRNSHTKLATTFLQQS
jgi:hypothetical protein